MIVPVETAGPKEVGKALFAAFSEMHVTAEDTIVEGDRVVERHCISAVHTGEFNGVPATGRKVCWTEHNIYRIKDGKIAETWTETSLHDLMAQITAKQTMAA
jgi:predicted ester cyclase